MININNVKSEYVVSPYERIVHIDDLIKDWEIMTYEERDGWWTAKAIRKRFYARDVIENEIYKLCEYEACEGMEDDCLDALTDEKIDNLQKVLDSISNHSAYDVYYEDEKIDPRSEVNK